MTIEPYELIFVPNTDTIIGMVFIIPHTISSKYGFYEFLREQDSDYPVKIETKLQCSKLQLIKVNCCTFAQAEKYLKEAFESAAKLRHARDEQKKVFKLMDFKI